MKNSKIIFILILIALIIIFIITFFRVNNVFSQIQEKREQVMTLEEKVDNIRTLERKQDIIEQREEEISSIFIDLETPVEFINFLEERFEQNNLLSTINPQIIRKEETDDWRSLRLQIEIRGNFSNFITFLKEIETAPFLLEILNITIQREPELSEEISASLLIKIFGKYE